MKNSETKNTHSLKTINLRAIFAALAFFICLLTSQNVSAASYVVTRVDDRNNATCAVGDCSLREAVNAANAAATNDTINFAIPAGDAGCASGVCTITLTLGELVVNDAATAGTLTITNSTGASNLLISGNNISRVFNLNSGANTTINGVTITKGNGTGTRLQSNGFGGGIFNLGTLTLTNSIVSGNTTNNGGGSGGIVNFGTTTLTNSTVSGNTSAGDGGGIYNDDSKTLILTNSTVSGNTASSSGGGIYNRTFGATVTLTNSTVSSNVASGDAGGILNAGILNLTSVTVTQNSLTRTADCPTCAGGIDSSFASSQANLKNTIVAGNTVANASSSSPDFHGVVTAGSSYNLIGNGQGTTGITNGINSNQVGTATSPIDPKLAPLANKGGATQTHALLFGSPALDKGNSFGLTTDQRGLTRPVNDPSIFDASDGSDIGAFEVQAAPTAATVSVGGRVMTTTGRGITNVRLALTDSQGNVRTTASTQFGYYRFDEVEAGATYIITATGKRFSFSQPS